MSSVGRDDCTLFGRVRRNQNRECGARWSPPSDRLWQTDFRTWQECAHAILRSDSGLNSLRLPDGNDWAHGFMRGTLMRHDGWLELVNDEEQGGCMVPIFMLHYEHEFSLQLSHQMWGLTITLGRRPRERQELIIPPVCLRARNSSWADRPMTVERP